MSDELWWNPPITPKFGEWCPCGLNELKSPYEWAIGICDECRKTAKKKPRKGEAIPDFVDVALPGLENCGKARRDVAAMLATITAGPDPSSTARTGGENE
jgi:hypothetical protein